MARTHRLPALLAIVMLAGVIGTFSLLSAQSADPARPGRRDEPRLSEREREELLLAQRRRDEQPEPLRREEEQRALRERMEMERRERQGMEERMRRGEPEPPFRLEQMEQFARMMEMVKHMQHTCFDPEAAAMVALAGLKDDVPREPQQVAEDLEATLKRTRTLGLRNAIRMMLRDLYRHLEKPDRVLDHLREMLAENDAALQAGPPPQERPEPRGGRPERAKAQEP